MTDTESSENAPWRQVWKLHGTDVLYAYLTEIQKELQVRASDETYRLVRVESDTFFSCFTLYYEFVFQGTKTGTIKTCYTPLPLSDEEIVEGWTYMIRASEANNNILTDVMSITPVTKIITPFRSCNARLAKEYQV